MPTTKLGLPLLNGNMTADVVRDHNALAEAVDIKVGVSNGLATLGEDGKVPSSQLNISAPAEATTSVKGIVMLEDSVTSASVTKAATPNSVKTVSEQVAAHSADDTSHVRYGVASGTNAKVVTLSPTPIILVEGFALSFKNVTQNSGAVTLNVNGLGAASVVKGGGVALASGNLKAGTIYTVRYDGSSFILQGEGASGNATASDLLSGKTATTDVGDITGAIPSKSAATITPGTTNQTIAAGQYLSGTQTIVGDPDLVEANILSGKNIFNVAGSALPMKKKNSSGSLYLPNQGNSGTATFAIPSDWNYPIVVCHNYEYTSSSGYKQYEYGYILINSPTETYAHAQGFYPQYNGSNAVTLTITNNNYNNPSYSYKFIGFGS